MPFESSSDPEEVFTFVSDGTVPRFWSTKKWRGLLLIAIGLMCTGVLASFSANADSLPTYRGRVILIGIAWGAVLIACVSSSILLSVLTGQRSLRRTVMRLYPAGSTTEVELGEDCLVIRRPTGERALPYRGMLWVRSGEVWIRVFMRGDARPELLPAGLLPAPVIGVLRGRAGRTPAMVVVPDQEPTCSMQVPVGWAAHLTKAATLATLRRQGFWVSTVALVAIGAVLGMLVSPGWWLVGPVLALGRFLIMIARAQVAMNRALPAGSTASTYVLADRFISHNAGGTREFLFDDVQGINIYGDVVVLRLGSSRKQFLLARTLLPPDVLADFIHR